MSRLIVEYNPPIAHETKKAIADNVTYSMESYDGTSFQYEIGAVLSHTPFFNDEDKNLIKQLESEGVNYIEI